MDHIDVLPLFGIRYSENQINEIIEKADLNQNGCIDYSGKFDVFGSTPSDLLEKNF